MHNGRVWVSAKGRWWIELLAQASDKSRLPGLMQVAEVAACYYRPRRPPEVPGRNKALQMGWHGQMDYCATPGLPQNRPHEGRLVRSLSAPQAA